jgi:hypothetical protein
LELSVAAGHPPLTANNDSGTATGLSADKLDGKDSSGYANATNGKANDADKLDGIDSTGFLRSNAKAADSDRLDGKDQSAFLGATAKAADSDKVDGKDAGAFLPSDTYRVTTSETGPGGGGGVQHSTLCDPGDVVLGGGGGLRGLFESHPLEISEPFNDGASDPRGWLVSAKDGGGPSRLDVSALCADFPPFHQ